MFRSHHKISVAALVLLLTAATAAQAEDPFLKFGEAGRSESLIGVGWQPEPGLQVVADTSDRGLATLRDPVILSQAGGGFLLRSAAPHPKLESQDFSLRYDAQEPDGRRTRITIGANTVYVDAYDWELRPVALLVDSGYHAAINIESGDTHHVVLHEALQDTLLGLRFIQADLSPRGKIDSQDYLPRDRDGLLLGAGEETHLASETAVRQAAGRLRREFGQFAAAYTVLVDADVDFSYRVVDDRLVLSGSPYYYAWHWRNDQVVPDAANDALIEAWGTFQEANPVVVRSMERAYRLAAFFRRLKEDHPQDWQRFVEDVTRIELNRVPTPQRLGTSRK